MVAAGASRVARSLGTGRCSLQFGLALAMAACMTPRSDDASEATLESTPALATPPTATPVVLPPPLVPPPPGMESFAGATLRALGPGTAFLEIELGTSVGTFENWEGDSHTAAIDLTATHPRCGDVPTCLVVAGSDRLELLFFGVQDEILFEVECVSVPTLRTEQGDDAVAALRNLHGGWVVHDTAQMLCVNKRLPPYEVRR